MEITKFSVAQYTIMIKHLFGSPEWVQDKCDVDAKISQGPGGIPRKLIPGSRLRITTVLNAPGAIQG